MRATGSRRRGSPGTRHQSVSNPGDERKSPAPQSRRVQRPGGLDAGPFAADIASFRLHLAAENKAAGTIRIYTDAARWFATSRLLAETGKTRWEQVDAADVREWIVWLLGRYSEAYAYQQYRSLQQFFRWLAVEEDLPSPMARLRPPKVAGRPVPYFTSDELSRLARECQGGTFAQRRDAAILDVFLATGIRIAELAAAALRRQRTERQSAAPLRPHHGRLTCPGPQL